MVVEWTNVRLGQIKKEGNKKDHSVGLPSDLKGVRVSHWLGRPVALFQLLWRSKMKNWVVRYIWVRDVSHLYEVQYTGQV
ncbi:hypothetical protein BSQ39_02745 [Loigolactobacillus backii]|nr:hypothetical protein AYR52_09270 [Loigolactobacillus backii]ANK65305.1 hypothetical protein AYR54_08675 [Loigolactobacillus backii]ANK67866.1 hypothetical protein AYR55_09285 [Loigolactobacillus backii]OLF69486.1 hypothetical protein ACX53_07755 [Loigolactobacillus backii]PIO82558.1 hypothetical protein BSQ39_02745 [Loigolactobacillus backii]